MPDIKEKLVELISKTPVKTGFANSTFGKSFQPILVEVLANYLIANGVTIQQWISVEERLPEPTYCVLVYSADGDMEIDAIGSDGEWMSYLDITHWMPLPEPPAEEEHHE